MNPSQRSNHRNPRSALAALDELVSEELDAFAGRRDTQSDKARNTDAKIVQFARHETGSPARHSQPQELQEPAAAATADGEAPPDAGARSIAESIANQLRGRDDAESILELAFELLLRATDDGANDTPHGESESQPIAAKVETVAPVTT